MLSVGGSPEEVTIQRGEITIQRSFSATTDFATTHSSVYKSSDFPKVGAPGLGFQVVSAGTLSSSTSGWLAGGAKAGR